MQIIKMLVYINTIFTTLMLKKFPTTKFISITAVLPSYGWKLRYLKCIKHDKHGNSTVKLLQTLIRCSMKEKCKIRVFST